MKIAGSLHIFGLALFGFVALSSCGDVTSELITRGDAGSTMCQSDAECPDERPRCELDSARCVECLATGDCQMGQVCALPAGTCIAGCDADTDCPSSTPVCEVSSGLCRGCAEDDECPVANPKCNPAGRCVQCLQTTDCPIIEDPLVCDPAGRCVECMDGVPCAEQGETCNTFLGECAVRCEDGCNLEDPICAESIGNFCVECLSAADCGGDECRNFECVEGP